MRRWGAYAGLLVIVLSNAILIVSLLANPWFSFGHHSISDLGRRSAQFNTVYDGGLIAVALLLVFFLSQAYEEQKTRLGQVGLAIFGLTGIALLVIGFRSNGVSLSDSVALAFALAGGSGVFLLGVALMRQGVAYARLSVSLAVTGTVLAVIAIRVFAGLALAELIAIAGYEVTIGVLASDLNP